MKNLIEKLRDVNYKRVAIEDAEKAVFGLACLLMLVCLIGTSWRRYERAPDEFVQKVDSESINLHRSAWPDEKRAKYDANENISLSVKQLLTKVNVTRFQYNTPFIVPLYPHRERIKQPTLYAPEEPITKASEVILYFRNEQREIGNADSQVRPVPKKQEKTSDVPDPIAPRSPHRSQGDTDPHQRDGDGGAAGRKQEIDEPEAGAKPNTGPRLGIDPKQSDPDVNVASNDHVHAEGKRFVSMVAIVPLRKFALSYSKALNMESLAAAADEVQFQSFELQRQIAVAGANPWSGTWRPVNFDVAKQILTTAEGYELEVVSSALTDSVFTMPLPKRAAGVWYYWATHPRLKSLSQQQREQQRLIDEKAFEKAQELQPTTRRPTEPGGFSDFRRNIRDARRRVGPRLMKSIVDEAMRQENIGPNVAELHATISGQVLLFRYLDFDVAPGNAYRYRLRLVLRNPNYDKPIEELADPEIAKAELLKTPWSQTTEPAVVRDYQEYYVTRIDRSRPQSTAVMKILQWYQNAGTLIQADLTKILPGQFIAAFDEKGAASRGKAGVVTKVLRPANKTLLNETIAVVTKDVLLDIDDVEEFNAEEHAELEIESKTRSEVAPAEKVLVVDQFGRLQMLDSVNGVRGAKSVADRIKQQNTPWLRFVNKNQTPHMKPGPLDQ